MPATPLTSASTGCSTRSSGRPVPATSNRRRVTLQETSFGAQVVDVIDRAADSSGGVIYGDSIGRITYRAADWQAWVADNPPDATIGNVPDDPNLVLEAGDQVMWFGDDVIFGDDAAGGDVCPVAWELSFELTDIATQVHAGRSRGNPRRCSTTPPTRSGTGWRRSPAPTSNAPSTVIITDHRPATLAALSADYLPNVAAVTLDAATSTAARDLCVTVDPTVPSRYRCRLHRAAGRVVFDRQFLAVGVQHRIDPAGWETRIALDDAAPYMIAAPLPSAQWDVRRMGRQRVELT